MGLSSLRPFGTTIEVAAKTEQLPTRIIRRVVREIARDPLRKIYVKYRDHTIIPEIAYLYNLEIAATVQSVAGCIIECGVWRGGMIAGIADLLGPERQYFLFDSFQGLPSVQNIDGTALQAWQANTKGPTTTIIALRRAARPSRPCE
jgi:Macrocin-O-methyltransferase (TylF)